MHTDSNRYSPNAAVVRSVCWCLVWRLQCVNVVIWKMTLAKSFNFADWELHIFTTCTVMLVYNETIMIFSKCSYWFTDPVTWNYKFQLHKYVLIFQVENLVAIELAYINTKHPDFHKDAALVSSLLKSVEEDERFLRPANKRQNPAHVNQPMPTVVGESEKDMPKVGHIEKCLIGSHAC